MARLLQVLFVGCAVLAGVGWWKTDTLPEQLSFVRALSNEPRQESVAKSTIDVRVGNVDYRVEPSHRYALDGLVVSHRVHDADYLLHRLWNDHLNVADVCVVWGRNAGGVDLHAFEFRNGEFTCFYETRSERDWRAFRTDQIANNHLITADPALRAAIEDIAVGDQVHLEGYLASYSNGDGFRRGSSTTRTDTGNGACETVYVTAFDVVAPAPRGWQHLASAALWGMFASASLWFVGVGKGWL